MMDINRNREQCLTILQEFTKSEGLLKHAYKLAICVLKSLYTILSNSGN